MEMAEKLHFRILMVIEGQSTNLPPWKCKSLHLTEEWNLEKKIGKAKGTQAELTKEKSRFLEICSKNRKCEEAQV